MIFFGKILLKTLYFFITNISELDFEEKKSAEIVLHPMHGGGEIGGLSIKTLLKGTIFFATFPNAYPKRVGLKLK